MEANMAGDDATLDTAVASIAAKLRGGDVATSDRRESRGDRDSIERDDYTDLDELEAIDRRERAEKNSGNGEPQQKPEKAKAEANGDEEGESENAGAEIDEYLELPAAEEGGEPERIPVKEAAEAYKQLRQMNGDIASAVIKAQDEQYAKNQQSWQAVQTELTDARRTIQVLMSALPVPQMPHPSLRDSDPDTYYRMRDNAEYYQDLLHKAQTGERELDDRTNRATLAAMQERVNRENERLARYIPEWGKPETREAVQKRLTEGLVKHYGFSEDELNAVPFNHKTVRVISDLLALKEKPAQQAQVRKELQTKAPKITRTHAQPSRDPSNGRFLSEARKELRETGSEDAFARMLLKSGALKGL